MKINQNRPETKQVPVNVINTLVEQISDLQTDVATLQNDVEGLEQSVDTVNIEATEAQIDRINATNISSTNATINTITSSNKINANELDAHDGSIDNLVVGNEIVETATITDATIATANITDLDAVNGSIQHLDAGTVNANSLRVGNLSISGNTTTNGTYNGKDVNVVNVTASNHVTTTELNILDTANIKDLNISGQINGVSTLQAGVINTNEINASNGKIEELANTGTFLNPQQIPLTPTPRLDNTDTYTIELPTFTGSMILIWKDGEFIKWKAYVNGSGGNYTINWTTPEDTIYVQKLFQWNNHLYIRHNANGQLFYSYNTDHKIEDGINIYYNMQGWPYPQSLEELCDENHEIDVIRPGQTVQFGAVEIPMLDGGNGNGAISFKGECAFEDIPSFELVVPGDVWNITDESYTDERFVEGAGKPINAGDDIVAVVVEVGDDLVMMWDKFAAGVNYDNFVATNITANGTLSVNGAATFNNNITQTGNYTATGNLNRTGNETITGKVIIGDLD